MMVYEKLDHMSTRFHFKFFSSSNLSFLDGSNGCHRNRDVRRLFPMFPMETGVDHWADARSDARSMLTTIFFRKHLIRIGMLDTY